VIELGTAAVIEREQRPMRAVLIDVEPLASTEAGAAGDPDTAATVDRDTYLATFQAAPLWPLSRQEN
jgi:hypothetical protein